MDPRQEDAHWRRWHQREHAHPADRDYEDYAPAYCVGYVGCSQYGGSYSDAEVSLHANWARIRGDSRLSLDEARAAMRAAWDRVAARAGAAPAWTPLQSATDGLAEAIMESMPRVAAESAGVAAPSLP